MIDTTRLVVLVDGSSYLFRAFHGLPPLTSHDGHPTGAMHGVIKMLTKLYDDYQPNYFGVIFDAKGKTFRNDMYPLYKANRPPLDNDLRVQIQPLQQLIEALGFPLIIEPGVEADDVIGTLSKKALKAHYQVLISTGDKDMAQLLTHADISLVDTMKDEVTTASDVAHRFKVSELKANQVIDFLALVGDTSDNIPGVAKVGPKTAAKWLAEYGSVENIIHNATKIGGKVGDNLRAGIEQLKLSYKLATIKDDLPLALDIPDLALQPANVYKIKTLCDTYDLKSVAARFLNAPEVTTPSNAPIEKDYTLVSDSATRDALFAQLASSLQFAIDTETTSLDYMHAELVGISLCLEAGKAYYLPLAHQLAHNLPFQETLDKIKPILENAAIGKIGQHLKYDRHIFARYGIAINGVCDDTMLMSYCYNSTATRHNMDALADYYLNYQTTTFEDVAGKGAKQLTFDQIDTKTAANYAAEDADITRRLYDFFANKLANEPKLNALYQEVEVPMAEVLFHMEETGVKIDAALLAKMSAEMEAKLQALQDKAYGIAGETFNLSSPKQLREIFFDKLNLPVVRKTPTGIPSTNEEVLQELAEVHHLELPKVILEYRGFSKLKSTYTDALPKLIDKRTGRIHTSYHQALTSTGRLSSSDPNLQNIPVRSDEGRRIRQAFIAEKGFKVLASDYSQIELRIMAHLSGDDGLINAFHHGMDIHRATASEIFGVPPEDIDRNQRRNAKAINFGLIYGMSAFGLSRQLNIPRKEAEAYIDTYFSRYPKVHEFMEAARATARQQGYVETLLGRRLYVPDINSKNAIRRNAAERLAINAPMQGSAADIIKLAMIDIDKKYHDNAACRLIMQVHDELVFEVREDVMDELKADIEQRMQHAYELKVPLIVDARIGENWDEAH